jgi:copper chaperone CopZ
MKTSTINTPALFGDHHVTEVRRILLSLPGVTEVYASSAFQVVEVTYDETKINDLEIAVKLDEAGYLREWTVPIEQGSKTRHADGEQKPYFRHTMVYETTKKTVSFAQGVNYNGRPLWPCPGMGTIPATREEDDHA